MRPTAGLGRDNVRTMTLTSMQRVTVVPLWRQEVGMLTFSHRAAFAGCLAALALAAFLASVGPLVASPGPAVGLSASAGAAAVAAGERLAFTVKLVNTGDEKANNLAISAALAPGFVYVPGSAQLAFNGIASWYPDQNPIIVGQNLTWDADAVPDLAVPARRLGNYYGIHT